VNWIEAYGYRVAMRRAVPLADALRPLFDGQEPLLDVGCGPGHLGHRLGEISGREVVSLDVRTYPFTHPQVNVQLYDGQRIPFPDKSFDNSLIAFTLHHTDDPVVILQEMMRVTRRRIVVGEDMLRSRKDILSEVFKDLISNYFVAEITFQYRTDAEWERLFGLLGLRVARRVEFESGGLIRYQHIGWALDLDSASA
jgi:ubiquinone/menaquinone biosynthesis C-methylase UbiE